MSLLEICPFEYNPVTNQLKVYYDIQFDISTPNNENENFQLIRHHILQSDTFFISSGATKSWPQGDYQLIINTINLSK